MIVNIHPVMNNQYCIYRLPDLLAAAAVRFWCPVATLFAIHHSKVTPCRISGGFVGISDDSTVAQHIDKTKDTALPAASGHSALC